MQNTSFLTPFPSVFCGLALSEKGWKCAEDLTRLLLCCPFSYPATESPFTSVSSPGTKYILPNEFKMPMDLHLRHLYIFRMQTEFIIINRRILSSYVRWRQASEILRNQRKNGCARDPVLFTAVSSAAATGMQSDMLRSSQRKSKPTRSVFATVSCQERQRKARVLPTMVFQLPRLKPAKPRSLAFKKNPKKHLTSYDNQAQSSIFMEMQLR